MPSLSFVATRSDLRAILDVVYREPGVVVFEHYSVPDQPLRTFSSSEDVLQAFDSWGALMISLYATSMRGKYRVERFRLSPNAIPGKSWREQIHGWGLIKFDLHVEHDGSIESSWTNHNSEKRALKWEGAYHEAPPVADWDFQEVSRISRRINRQISKLAGHRGGSCVLPEARELLRNGKLRLGAAPRPSPQPEPPTPCPFCGKPLRTAKARQCRHCLADWHTPKAG